MSWWPVILPAWFIFSAALALGFWLRAHYWPQTVSEKWAHELSVQNGRLVGKAKKLERDVRAWRTAYESEKREVERLRQDVERLEFRLAGRKNGSSAA